MSLYSHSAQRVVLNECPPEAAMSCTYNQEHVRHAISPRSSFDDGFESLHSGAKVSDAIARVPHRSTRQHSPAVRTVSNGITTFEMSPAPDRPSARPSPRERSWAPPRPGPRERAWAARDAQQKDFGTEMPRLMSGSDSSGGLSCGAAEAAMLAALRPMHNCVAEAGHMQEAPSPQVNSTPRGTDFQGVAQSYNSMMEQNQRMHEKLTVLTNIMMTSSEVKKGQQSLENRLDDLLNRVVLVSENGKAECQQMFVKDATASTGGADASSDRSADLNLKEPRERQRSSDSLYFSEVSRSSKLGDLLEVRRQEVIEDRSKHSLSHSVAICCERITCAAFTMACLVMLSLWARHVNHGAFVGTFFITAIAAMTYYAKSCHMGDWVILGQAVPVARYLDWFTTTPLMLYELCHIAHAPASDTIMLIMCDLAMIATGIIAALIPWKPHAKHKMVWFILSCMFYVLMLVTIYVDVSAYAKKQTEEAANLFKQLEVLMISVWSFYPIVVLLGRAQLGIITKPVEDVMLCILDATAKIGMEGFIVATCFTGCLATEGGDGH